MYGGGSSSGNESIEVSESELNFGPEGGSKNITIKVKDGGDWFIMEY